MRAWADYPNLFLILLGLSLFSDSIDGFLALSAYVAPILVGFLKFRRLPSLHTWSAKTAAVLMSVSALLLFIADIAWPFRIAAIFQALVASEEIAILFLLRQWRGNVHSLWHACKCLKDDCPK